MIGSTPARTGAARAALRPRSLLLALPFAIAALVSTEGARADDACGKAYEESQVARSESRLRAAQTELRECVRPECPEFVRTDCARWLSEVESALPSIVVTATSNGAEVEDVEVEFDGEVLSTRLDGKAVQVDPGRHVLRFTRKGEDSVTLEVTIREGERSRRIPVNFERRPPPPDSTLPAPAQVGPRYGFLPHVLLGVGVAGLAGFTTFALIGNKDRRDLEATCAPRCDDAPVDAVHRKYVMADASLAVGVLALAASGYLFWSSARDSTSATASPRVEAGVTLTSRGGSGVARWRF